jgi:hypothetical protein
MMPPTFLHCCGNVFTELLPSSDRGIHRQNHRLTFDNTQITYKMMYLKILLLLLVFIAAVTCLPSPCLKLKGGIHLTELLHCNNRRDTHTDTDWWEQFMKYTVELGSVTMVYIPNCIKIGSGIQNLIGEILRCTDRVEIT